ncbi:MAG: SUMF1/EgtB/PvdO family nonheme iron enzyme [Elusimicrobia bacterium]|nr:SUMF1/EgtB/PvdO family nonheme iron enzyme [Elusimicrobiota bacterium]
MTLCRRFRLVAWVLALGAMGGPGATAQDRWPDLAAPAKAVGGGGHDAAVVVGVEDYLLVADVPGAEANAKAWYDYFTETRGLPVQNVKLVTGVDATREEMLAAVRSAAGKAGQDGTLWFVFIGHGAPSKDGKDGLLVAVDAQQKAATLQERSLKRSELLKALSESRAGSIRVVLDACFSGRLADGGSIAPGLQPLVTVSMADPTDARMVVLTAARGNQFAGALPGARRPAFSYLVLGGLRGWTGKATVTAGDLWRYAVDALEATLRGRDQWPELIGRQDAVVGAAAGEKGPNLAGLAKATAGAGAQDEMFRVSNLPRVPKAQAPAAVADMAGGADFRNLDVEALGRYDEATKFDEGEASPEEKASKWLELAKSAPQFAGKAEARAAQWDRYAQELAAGQEARQKRAEAMDRDWEKLGKLLAMRVVPDADKKRWAAAFVEAYGRTSRENPYVADLARHLPPGTVKVEPGAKASAGGRAGSVQAGKAGVEWVRIPGGTLAMGADDRPETKPRHPVTVKAFQLARTEATNKQYRACVEAGACSPAHASDGTCRVWDGGQWALGSLAASFQADDHPVVCVDWGQAKAFAEWAGGRLPSEAEWEHAARGAGKERAYPWGDEEPTCERAVMSQDDNGCARNATWPVCSKAAGNTAQGLCDMAGNVGEWTQDWYHASYDGAPADGLAWERPASAARVVRGGGWGNDADGVRAAYRVGYDPGELSDYLGVRPAR